MKTAEEFLLQKPFIHGMTRADQAIAMIEFAKLHVKEALKQASEKAQAYNKPKFSSDINPQVDMESILNAYPLENII